MTEKKDNKKISVSVSLSKYLKDKMDDLVDKGDFASISEIVSIAVTRFLVEYEREKKAKIT